MKGPVEQNFHIVNHLLYWLGRRSSLVRLVREYTIIIGTHTLKINAG